MIIVKKFIVIENKNSYSYPTNEIIKYYFNLSISSILVK